MSRPLTPEIAIVSLTEAGNRLAQRITLEINAEHLHRPVPFTETVQQRYKSEAKRS